MSEPIYRVTRRQDDIRVVPHVERERLLSPTEREEARRKREQARRKVAKRTEEPPRPEPSQGRDGGVDYSA